MKNITKLGLSIVAVVLLAGCQQELQPQQDNQPQQEKQTQESSANVNVSSNATISRGDVTVTVEKDASTNRVVLIKNGERKVLYSGDLDLKQDGSNISNLKVFSNIRLDMSGKYLLFTTSAWEVVLGILYDIEKEKEIVQFRGTDRFDFTPDNKFVYACAANDFGGEYYGEVIDLESQEKVFEIPEEEIEKYAKNEYDIECNADSESRITFTASSLNSNGEPLKVEKIFTYPN